MYLMKLAMKSQKDTHDPQIHVKKKKPMNLHMT